MVVARDVAVVTIVVLVVIRDVVLCSRVVILISRGSLCFYRCICSYFGFSSSY